MRAWIQVLTELQAFVKQHHTTGLVWNNTKGGDAVQNSARAASAAPSGPPPPPMPSGQLFLEESNADGGDEKSRAQLFAALNKGEHVTKGLKKVTADMQTHKNPNLRTGPSPIAPKPQPGSPARTAVVAAAPAKPPRKELEGKKWMIEYQKNQTGIIISETEMNQVVYIFKCEGSTIQVKGISAPFRHPLNFVFKLFFFAGKVNSIVLDSCKKTSVVLDSVVSSVEFVNCQSVQMQVLTKVPTISIDKTDGCQIYLNPASLDVSIVSAKSSEMNVLVPKPDGDYVSSGLEMVRLSFHEICILVLF